MCYLGICVILQPVVNSVLYESENITLDPLEKEIDNVAVITNNLFTRVSF